MRGGGGGGYLKDVTKAHVIKIRMEKYTDKKKKKEGKQKQKKVDYERRIR